MHNLAVENNEIDQLTEVMEKTIKNGSWLILLNWRLIRNQTVLLKKVNILFAFLILVFDKVSKFIKTVILYKDLFLFLNFNNYISFTQS